MNVDPCPSSEASAQVQDRRGCCALDRGRGAVFPRCEHLTFAPVCLQAVQDGALDAQCSEVIECAQCPICAEDMCGVQQGFEPVQRPWTHVGEKNSAGMQDAVRIECGHAFHDECLFLQCKSARQALEAEAEDDGFDYSAVLTRVNCAVCRTPVLGLDAFCCIQAARSGDAASFTTFWNRVAAACMERGAADLLVKYRDEALHRSACGGHVDAVRAVLHARMPSASPAVRLWLSFALQAYAPCALVVVLRHPAIVWADARSEANAMCACPDTFAMRARALREAATQPSPWLAEFQEPVALHWRLVAQSCLCLLAATDHADLVRFCLDGLRKTAQPAELACANSSQARDASASPRDECASVCMDALCIAVSSAHWAPALAILAHGRVFCESVSTRFEALVLSQCAAVTADEACVQAMLACKHLTAAFLTCRCLHTAIAHGNEAAVRALLLDSRVRPNADTQLHLKVPCKRARSPVRNAEVHKALLRRSAACRSVPDDASAHAANAARLCAASDIAQAAAERGCTTAAALVLASAHGFSKVISLVLAHAQAPSMRDWALHCFYAACNAAQTDSLSALLSDSRTCAELSRDAAAVLQALLMCGLASTLQLVLDDARFVVQRLSRLALAHVADTGLTQVAHVLLTHPRTSLGVAPALASAPVKSAFASALTSAAPSLLRPRLLFPSSKASKRPRTSASACAEPECADVECAEIECDEETTRAAPAPAPAPAHDAASASPSTVRFVACHV